MKILITGATGFVGGALTRYFSLQGHDIIATGRSNADVDIINQYGRFVQWDLENDTKNFDVDICIHSAGLADDQASLSSLRRVNAQGTEKLINSVRANKFIYISSSSVYNFGPRPQKENDHINLNKLQNYGRSKREGELIVLENASKFHSTTCLRPRVIYGKGDRLLAPRLIAQVKNDRLRIPGNLDILSSMCSVNLINEMIDVIIKRHEGTDIFNVVDPHTYTMKKAFESILNAYFEKQISFMSIPLGIVRPIAKISDWLPWKTKLSSMALANLSQDRILSDDKMKSFLGHTPVHSYYEHIENDISWYQESIGKSGNLAWKNV